MQTHSFKWLSNLGFNIPKKTPLHSSFAHELLGEEFSNEANQNVQKSEETSSQTVLAKLSFVLLRGRPNPPSPNGRNHPWIR